MTVFQKSSPRTFPQQPYTLSPDPLNRSSSLSVAASFIVAAVLIISGIATRICVSADEGSGISMTATANEIFDDNITSSKADKRSDFITRMIFGLGGQYEGKTSAVKVRGRINQDFFAHHHEFTNTAEDVTVDWRSDWSRFDHIAVKNVFSHSDEARSFDEAFGRAGGRFGYYKNRASVEYANDVSKQLTLRARYTHELNEIGDKTITDSMVNRAAVEGVYDLTSALMFLPSYAFGQRSFDPGGNVRSHTIAGALRRYLTNQLYVESKLGTDFFSSAEGTNYVKPLIALSLSDNLDENTRTMLSFTKGYDTTSYSQNIFRSWRFSGALTRQLLKRLSGSVAGFYGKGTYVASDIRDELWGGSVGVSYDITRNVKGQVGYRHASVDSTQSGRGYGKNTVAVGMTAEF